MTITASSALAPIRIRIPGMLDVLVVRDPHQIQWLNAHEHVVRPLDPGASLLHRILDRRLRVDLGFDHGLLPVFRARSDAERARTQAELEERLEGLRGAPGPERDEIAAYVSGAKDADEIGVTVQHWCGKLFLPHYRAARATYAAGRLLASWPSAPPWRTIRARRNGELAQAKREVQNAADADLHCIHGTTIGMENLARSVRNLRAAADDPAKQYLSPDEILRECLVAPPAVLRGCTRTVEAPFLKTPLSQRTLVVFLVATAYRATGDLDVAFLAEDWSACPARHVIPEMLRAVWHAAHHDEIDDESVAEVAEKHLFTTIHTLHGLGRIWQRVLH